MSAGKFHIQSQSYGTFKVVLVRRLCKIFHSMIPLDLKNKDQRDTAKCNTLKMRILQSCERPVTTPTKNFMVEVWEVPSLVDAEFPII